MMKNVGLVPVPVNQRDLAEFLIQKRHPLPRWMFETL
jgi:hypothetical protein